MREIKFEYILLENNTFVDKEILTLEDIEQQNTKEFCYEILKENEKIIKRQYTGLKDKNGIEIYNKDIIKDGSRLWIVEISSLYGVILRLLKDKKITKPYVKFEKHLIDDFEVIGNIYENEELLKEVDENR